MLLLTDAALGLQYINIRAPLVYPRAAPSVGQQSPQNDRVLGTRGPKVGIQQLIRHYLPDGLRGSVLVDPPSPLKENGL